MEAMMALELFIPDHCDEDADDKLRDRLGKLVAWKFGDESRLSVFALDLNDLKDNEVAWLSVGLGRARHFMFILNYSFLRDGTVVGYDVTMRHLPTGETTYPTWREGAAAAVAKAIELLDAHAREAVARLADLRTLARGLEINTKET